MSEETRRACRPSRRRGVPVLASAALVVAATALPAQQPDNLRILTYNTAFLYVKAKSNLPGPTANPCFSCNPLDIPPQGLGPLCTCYPDMSLWLNEGLFAPITETDRATRIALEILDSDQDVVVLNEVFHPAARHQLVLLLAGAGPYKHYISLLRGHAPREGLTLNDLAAGAAGDLAPLVPEIPQFLDYDLVPGDSGLMIFSKYRFGEILGPNVINDAVCGDPTCRYEGESNGPLSPGKFAFKVFDACANFDCLASKGVGLVRIAAPRGPAYVAFTHTQADYPADGHFYPSQRYSQYDEIRQLLVGAIPQPEIRDAQIFVVGDLNTPGSHRGAASAGHQEWQRIYDPAFGQPNIAAEFFACGNGVESPGPTQPCRYSSNGRFQLTDSWGFETSPTDGGVTYHGGGTHDRLDYLLHSHRAGRLCMQHAMIAWDLEVDIDGAGGLTWLSDHLPIRGDFGLRGLHCSPNSDPRAALPQRNSRLLLFGPTNCTVGGAGNNPPCKQDEVVDPPQARLGPAGAFQWFRIEVAGTYSIEVDAANPVRPVDYVVYHHSDLSRPIAPFDPEEGENGLTFTMPDPPYYIRTFAVDAAGLPDRTVKGVEYTLRVHQHLCRSPEDACAIDPGRARYHPTRYQWPHTTASPITEVRELYWRFKTGGTRHGEIAGPADKEASFPQVRFQIEAAAQESYDCLTAVDPTILRYDNHQFPNQLLEQYDFDDPQIDADADWDNDGIRPDSLHQAPPLPGKAAEEMQTYFFRLTRDSSHLDSFNACNAGLTSFVGYLTNLTYFVPVQLLTFNPADDPIPLWAYPPDHMRLRTGFDESGWTPFPPAQSAVDKVLGQHSGPAPTGLHGYDELQGYYVDKVWPNMWEKDLYLSLGVWGPIDIFDGIDTVSEWEPYSGCISLTCESPTADEDVVSPHLLYADGPNPGEADYYYALYYARCHRKEELACGGE